jgi:sugar-specific transcriptional regulator TrmB
MTTISGGQFSPPSDDFWKKMGIDPKETRVYMELLKNGPNRASVLSYRLKLPRSTVQNILQRLEREKFLTMIMEKNSYLFSAAHPQNLEELMELKKRENSERFDQVKAELRDVAPYLSSLMIDQSSYPSVRFYQGREAVRTVLFDTLNSKTELKGFVNADAMFELVKDINDEYVAAREKTKVKKKGIILDTPFARKNYSSGKYSPKSYAGYRFIDRELYPFAVEVNIYDGKVSFLTYVEDHFVGVIVENAHIYQIHESLWNFVWDHLPEE